MNKTTVAQQAKKADFLLPAQGMLQRKCACGNHTVGGGECAQCAKNKSGLQRNLAIGVSNDSLEREADQVADQVMAASAHSAISGAPPRIQRYAGQAAEYTETAPASVGHVLAGSGRPMDARLQQDMEQRFGYDFSRVRVHSGATAEQSAREVNASAYTVGNDIVFGTGRFAPETHEGRRLIAHELTHVVQQSGIGGIRADLDPVLQRQPAPSQQPPTPQQIQDMKLSQLATLPHLALKQWKSLSQDERDKVLQKMTARYGEPFATEFQKYANGVKKPKPGLGGFLKGPEYTPKWLFERGYRHAYGEIWVHPSGEYLTVLAKDEGKNKPNKQEETYEYGGVTYYKSGKISSYPESMGTRCAWVCMNDSKNEEECSDCCVEKIPANDPGCLNLCIASCQDYYAD